MKAKAERIVKELYGYYSAMYWADEHPRHSRVEDWINLVNDILNEPDTPEPKQFTIEYANPCPFCGSKMELCRLGSEPRNYYMHCYSKDCGYYSTQKTTIHEAVLAHNRVRYADE